MPTLPVKFFHSAMQGAPQLTNSWGALTELLDAVLVNGFNLKSVTSLTCVDGIATLTIASGHLFEVDQVVRVEGANEAPYNGEFRALTTTANALTFAVTGAPANATGALTVKAAPLGFEIAFTGASKRAYRSLNPLSNKPILRVDDSKAAAYTTTYAKFARVSIAEDMSSIDTFVGVHGPYDSAKPTANEITSGSGTGIYGGWFKWYYAKAGNNSNDTVAPGSHNRQWAIVGDDRGFYLFNESIDAGGMSGKCFGDFDSYRSVDGYSSILCAHDAYYPASYETYAGDVVGYMSSDWRVRFPRTLDTTGKIALRGHLQVGGPVGVSFTGLNTRNAEVVSGSDTGIAWPNGPDYGLILHPTLLMEGPGLRGRMPGMFFIHNDNPSFNHLDRIEGVAGYSGRKFLLVRLVHGVGSANYGAMVAFDLTGPWW